MQKLLSAPAPLVHEDVAALAAALEPRAWIGLSDIQAIAKSLDRRGFHYWHGFQMGAGRSIKETRTFTLSLSPGVTALESVDLLSVERAAARELDTRLRTVDIRVAEGNVDTPAAQVSTRQVYEWSAKSRARMVRGIGEIDYLDWDGDGEFNMVTLTLPGDWHKLTPTGKHFKNMFDRLRVRWEREIGIDFRCIWKLEFQRRGAPHFHFLARTPALVNDEIFEVWLSNTWADIVGADDEFCHFHETVCGAACDTEFKRHRAAGTAVDYSGATYSDPKRIAIYFLKHSSKTSDDKEYQHIVPELWTAPGAGPGRFWGFRKLRKAVAKIELDIDEYIYTRRVLRKLQASKMRAAVVSGSTVNKDKMRSVDTAGWRFDPSTGEVVRVKRSRPVRRVRKPVSLGAGGGSTGGWYMTNRGELVGAALVELVARHRMNKARAGRPMPELAAVQSVRANSKGLTQQPQLFSGTFLGESQQLALPVNA